MNSWLGAYLPALAKTNQRSKAPRRSRMKTSKPNSWTFCVAAFVTIAVALSVQLAGQTAAVKPSGGGSGSGTQWGLQVERIDPGNLNLVSFLSSRDLQEPFGRA